MCSSTSEWKPAHTTTSEWKPAHTTTSFRRRAHITTSLTLKGCVFRGVQTTISETVFATRERMPASRFRNTCRVRPPRPPAKGPFTTKIVYLLGKCPSTLKGCVLGGVLTVISDTVFAMRGMMPASCFRSTCRVRLPRPPKTSFYYQKRPFTSGNAHLL